MPPRGVPPRPAPPPPPRPKGHVHKFGIAVVEVEERYDGLGGGSSSFTRSVKALACTRCGTVIRVEVPAKERDDA